MPKLDNAPDQPAKKRNAPRWIKLFVFLHIVAITSWSLPNPPAQYVGSPPRTPLKVRTENPVAFASSSAEYLRTEFLIGNQVYLKDSPLKFYLLSSGFWQYWDMFSPNPSSIDIYSDAMVTYANGGRKLYRYPRIYDLPLQQKFLRERWRKFFERAGDRNYQYLWPLFGQRIALMCFDDPNNPPVTVELHKHSMTVNPPGKPETQEYKDELYFTYHVDLEKLRKDR